MTKKRPLLTAALRDRIFSHSVSRRVSLSLSPLVSRSFTTTSRNFSRGYGLRKQHLSDDTNEISHDSIATITTRLILACKVARLITLLCIESRNNVTS